jgi:signal peptidase I
VIFEIFKVRGASLAPEYRDGDFVVASALPIFFRPPRVGQVIVFQHAVYGRLIKRVERIEPRGQIVVAGSGAGSIDSRTFGPIGRQAVRGVVLWHIKRGG